MDSDPFFGVKDEVFKALNKTRGLYLRWRELSDTNGSTAEIEWTTTELRNALRSIEWDLEDLEDTIAIVEKNPNKFKIDNRELASRRNFIDATRDEVKSMKEKMSINRRTIDQDITARQPLLDSPTKATVIGGTGNGVNLPTSNNSNKLHHSLISQAGAVMAARHSSAKYSKLENQMDSPSHYAMGGGTVPMGAGTGFDSPSNQFLGETMSTQQRMMSVQDEQLDIISDSIGTLKTVSRQIGGELDEQAVMLDDFGNELENTDSKLDSTMKKVAKVLHMTNDSRQWTAIIILSVTLLIIIILFIIL